MTRRRKQAPGLNCVGQVSWNRATSPDRHSKSAAVAAGPADLLKRGVVPVCPSREFRRFAPKTVTAKLVFPRKVDADSELKKKIKERLKKISWNLSAAKDSTSKGQKKVKGGMGLCCQCASRVKLYNRDCKIIV